MIVELYLYVILIIFKNNARLFCVFMVLFVGNLFFGINFDI
ncbi:hypothetical protein ABID42_001439 [Arcicella rosea]